MAKGWVADIVAQRNGFDQILVEIEIAADGSGYPRNQLNMKDPVGDVVVSDQAENLGFVDIAGIGP